MRINWHTAAVPEDFRAGLDDVDRRARIEDADTHHTDRILLLFRVRSTYQTKKCTQISDIGLELLSLSGLETHLSCSTGIGLGDCLSLLRVTLWPPRT